ncbi:uncharacterized protein VTP21DRAFT_2444 [Calcarisporiella thermophila]|uniref:uncharacterized protein n=1 Tax=Calcarisporiella thermophila TaxID=911321 RepID=UPI0037447926
MVGPSSTLARIFTNTSSSSGACPPSVQVRPHANTLLVQKLNLANPKPYYLPGQSLTGTLSLEVFNEEGLEVSWCRIGFKGRASVECPLKGTIACIGDDVKLTKVVLEVTRTLRRVSREGAAGEGPGAASRPGEARGNEGEGTQPRESQSRQDRRTRSAHRRQWIRLNPGRVYTVPFSLYIPGRFTMPGSMNLSCLDIRYVCEALTIYRPASRPADDPAEQGPDEIADTWEEEVKKVGRCIAMVELPIRIVPLLFVNEESLCCPVISPPQYAVLRRGWLLHQRGTKIEAAAFLPRRGFTPGEMLRVLVRFRICEQNASGPCGWNNVTVTSILRRHVIVMEGLNEILERDKIAIGQGTGSFSLSQGQPIEEIIVSCPVKLPEDIPLSVLSSMTRGRISVQYTLSILAVVTPRESAKAGGVKLKLGLPVVVAGARISGGEGAMRLMLESERGGGEEEGEEGESDAEDSEVRRLLPPPPRPSPWPRPPLLPTSTRGLRRILIWGRIP